MEGEKTGCYQKRSQPLKFNNLNFLKCVFLSNEQFNVNKIHIPTQSLYLEETLYASTISEIENKISAMIDEIYMKLNKDNTGDKYKIPMPIFVLLGKSLEYEKSILEGETFIHTPVAASGYKLGTSTITTDTSGNIAILDYIKAYFSSGLQSEQDKNKYDTGIINTYKFKGNMRILLYVPYLTNKYKYITNFKDILLSSTFFYSLINGNYFLTFDRTSSIKEDYIKKLRKAKVNEFIINFIMNIFKEADRKKYTLYDDLINMCYEGGCISDVGEDLERLVPAFSDDDGKNTENAIKYSPFMPSKCLSKTNGFICNVKYASKKNIDIHDFLKKYSMKELKDSLARYTEINDKILNNEDVSKNTAEIDKYKSPIDLIIAIVNKYIKDGYSDNLNDEKKDIKIKKINAEGNEEEYTETTVLNHFSKEYSENIIKELSLLNKLYPGIPEIILSLYLFNETYKPDKIIYMPWGRYLLSNNHVLNLSEQLLIANRLFSINNRFALMANKNGIIYVYDRTLKTIIYFLNKTKIDNTKGIIIEQSGISVVFTDSNQNEKTRVVLNLPLIKTQNCKECKEPYSIIIDNDRGDLIIYGNAFFNSTSTELQNLINTERGLILNMNMQDFDLDAIINGDKELILKQQEEYLYCSNANTGCIK